MEPLQLAVELAKKAGSYQLTHLNDAHNIVMKGIADPVTEVDQICEQMIVDGIKQHFPQHGILGEERGGKWSPQGWLWVIDPLDGTVNYANGYPLFAVSIALCHDGVPVLGVIYEPNHDEMFIAKLGEGSVCNDRPIKVSQKKHLIDSVLVSGFAYGRKRRELEANIPAFTSMLFKTRALRRDGTAAVDLAYVACGRYDGFWEYHLKPWDVAAGTLLVTEAGGEVTGISQHHFTPDGGEILASNGFLQQSILREIVAVRPIKEE